MAVFDIFDAPIHWGNCSDARPHLIIEFRPNGIVGCFRISGSCYNEDCFMIPSHDPDFPATGLTKDSYIHDIRIIDIPEDALGRYRGKLSGQLLTDFRKRAGV